jgi:hypothetical protein
MMIRTSLLVTTALLLLFVLAASAVPQEVQQEVETFSTGPVGPMEKADKRIAKTPSMTLIRSERGPHDGSDIRANPSTLMSQNETSVSVNPLNPLNIVCVGNDYTSGNWQTGYYTTLDGGQTWVGGLLPLEPGFSFSGDPCVAFNASGHAIIVCMQYYGPAGSAVYAYRSINGGLNFGTGTQIDLEDGNDKPQIAADLGGGPYHGSVATAWDKFYTSSGSHIYASSSTDGIAWSMPRRVNDSSSTNTIAPDVTYGANSELYVVWADRGTYDIWVDVSLNNGITWGSDNYITPYSQVPSPIPGSAFRMFDIFAMAADQSEGPYSGNLYVAYHTWENSPVNHADIRCATSTDQGATWTSNVLVNFDDTTYADQVMPGAFVDPNGNINITFYDRRLDPSNYLLWTFVARSSDGGTTFANYRGSDVGWDHNNTESGYFIGDYIDVDGSSNEIVPCWCDGRSGSQDVFIDKMHLNFFTDIHEISVATGDVITFNINIGPNYGGGDYIVLGGVSGTVPGTYLGNGVHMDLNWDVFTNFTVNHANSVILPNSMGILDATGSATAQLNTLGPLDPGLVGLNLDFVVVVVQSKPVFASNPTRVTLVP